MWHEIQRNEMLHNEHETEIELFLPTRSAHSRTSKEKSILRTFNISDDLKWSSHISKITSKASCTLGFLRRNLRQCPQECKKLACLAMVRSILEHGCLIWDPYTNKDIDKLESIQKRAARFIKHDYKSRESSCVTNMLKDLELKPLQERRKHI